MRVARAASAAVAALLAACAPSAPPERAKVQPTAPAPGAREQDGRLVTSAARLQLLLQLIRSDGEADVEPVPDFELESPDGARYSSRALVGKKPFVVAFFATWCHYCEGELAAVQEALRQVGSVPVIPVSADGPDTWDGVPKYLAAFGIADAPVRATDYRRFFATYNPADSLPALVIVGRRGTLVDYIDGYDPANGERLLASLRQAKAVAPLTWPALDASQ